MPRKVCSSYDDQCAQLVTPAGKTVRGCYQEILTTCSSHNCEIFQTCTPNNCNGKLFPPNRLFCYQCSDGTNCPENMILHQSLSQVCGNYERSDQCFAVTDYNIVHRGCVSDKTEAKDTCDRLGSKCLKCSESNCNSASSGIEGRKLQCHECFGSIKTSDCAAYQGSNSRIWCDLYPTFGVRQKCYTSVANGIIRRGCTSDNYCKSHDCEECSFDNCNNRNKAQMSCYQCNSLEGTYQYHKGCIDLKDLQPRSCRLRFDFDITHRGCYSAWINATVNGKVVAFIERACIDREMEGKAACEDDDNDSCIACKDDNCNNHDVSMSKRITLNISVFITFTLFIHIIKFKQLI
ncbi:uncharacterized protein LOC132258051 [Phlebotomus argentipes]|uniref:uncharacterized protein LOC132258051 n=1 Tax=Phlebotomus argentipes TaxID=94469 RepID=UPI002892B876|nr:uncharacterized protein LOC132258051 [Phlebotomus argentipes]